MKKFEIILIMSAMAMLAACNTTVSSEGNSAVQAMAFPEGHNCARWNTREATRFWEAATVASVRECLALNPGWPLETAYARWTPLQLAARNSNSGVVTELLRAGASVSQRNADRFTALRYAARYNDAETVRVLVNAGADPNERYNDGWRPIHFAARYNSVDVIQALIDAGANPASRKSIRPFTALELAKATDREPEIIRVLERAIGN